MKLSQLPQRTLTFHLHGDYEGIQITANQQAKVADLDLLMRVAGQDFPPVGDIAKALSGLILEWNIEEEDGSPMEVSEANLCKVNVDMLLAVLKAWFEEFSNTRPLGQMTV